MPSIMYAVNTSRDGGLCFRFKVPSFSLTFYKAIVRFSSQMPFRGTYFED
jgi:hypothetical protein